MSVFIPGMEMPKDGLVTIDINSDGTVYRHNAYPTTLFKAVEIKTPHGRLGDLTEVEKNLQNTLDGMGDKWLSSPTLMAQRVAIVADLKKVKSASTIIEAEGGGEDG